MHFEAAECDLCPETNTEFFTGRHLGYTKNGLGFTLHSSTCHEPTWMETCAFHCNELEIRKRVQISRRMEILKDMDSMDSKIPVVSR